MMRKHATVMAIALACVFCVKTVKPAIILLPLSVVGAMGSLLRLVTGRTAHDAEHECVPSNSLCYVPQMEYLIAK